MTHTTRSRPHTNSRYYHTVQVTPLNPIIIYAITLNDTALTSIACIQLPHSVVCVHAHTHTHSSMYYASSTNTLLKEDNLWWSIRVYPKQWPLLVHSLSDECVSWANRNTWTGTPMGLCTLVHKWASWHRKNTTSAKLQVMTTTSTSEAFALAIVDDRENTIYYGQVHIIIMYHYGHLP